MFAGMDGLMMDRPLLIRDIARRVERLYPDREIVSRTHDGVERSTYGEVVARARRMASSLEKLGIKPGDRVATFGWNSRRHLELYLGVPASGAVLPGVTVEAASPVLIEKVRTAVSDGAGLYRGWTRVT